VCGVFEIAEVDGETNALPAIDRVRRITKDSTTTLWLGPSILAIFKNIAISGGAQAPVFRDASDSIYGRERVRFAINFSYLKYSSHTSSH